MTFSLSPTSSERLETVHPDLQNVVNAVVPTSESGVSVNVCAVNVVDVDVRLIYADDPTKDPVDVSASAISFASITDT